MAESLTRWIRGLQGALIKVIKPTEDKSVRLRRIFWSQAYIKETT